MFASRLQSMLLLLITISHSRLFCLKRLTLGANQNISSTSLFVFQITRRYAEFSAAIVSLNESFPDEKVWGLYNTLTNESSSTFTYSYLLRTYEYVVCVV